MSIIDKFVNTVTGSRAWDAAQGVGDRITSLVQGIQGYAGGLITSIQNGSPFVGMNYEQIPNVRQAIREYVTAIQTAADELNTGADVTVGVRGEIVEATKSYVQAVKDVCDAYVSQLLAYSDKMQEYYEAYAKSDETLSGNVSQEATELSGSVDTYTEQK